MIKILCCFFLMITSAAAYALDPCTISASLYFQLTEDQQEENQIEELFDKLVENLSEEQAPDDFLQRAVILAQKYNNREDVKGEVKKLWHDLADHEIPESALYEKTQEEFFAFEGYKNLSDNPLMNSKHYKTIKPWVLPKNHPMKNRLDAIFSASRALANKESFANAGFVTFKVQPRSFIRVARHADLPGYVVKVYLDDELRIKSRKPGWHWFAKRCEGAGRIAQILQKKRIQHFKVASKWIYPLPVKPKPAKGIKSPKAEILLAEDMNIVSNSESKIAWQTQMTPEILNELFVVISYAKGRSYRPDNIPYSRDGKFAFIDTEYPDERADFSTPTKYLNPEMAAYWLKLIAQGGP